MRLSEREVSRLVLGSDEAEIAETPAPTGDREPPNTLFLIVGGALGVVGMVLRLRV
jgi:hypothetical protein